MEIEDNQCTSNCGCSHADQSVGAAATMSTTTNTTITRSGMVPEVGGVNESEVEFIGHADFTGTSRVGIDVGSTTVKMVVLDELGEIVYKKYQKHYSDVRETVLMMLEDSNSALEGHTVFMNITGSGGLQIAKKLNIRFVQEVIACSTAVEELIPHTDVAIELGGEDAKITYFGDNIEQRMNGTCAGGTGAFIDQMSVLLQTDAGGLNELAKSFKMVYPIASRCGVFAKTDIQPLMNEGAAPEDISVSILQAVVNQSIGGLACGRPIEGNVAFLGGPLYFLSELRERFKLTLALPDENFVFPPDSHYFVATGAAYQSTWKGTSLLWDDFRETIPAIREQKVDGCKTLEALFPLEKDYAEFKERHSRHHVEKGDLSTYEGGAYLGIDAGSTTTKLALVGEDGKLLHSFYGSNMGSPLKSSVNALKELHSKMNSSTFIKASTVTGYGEHLIKAALKIDIGETETVSHFTAANFFMDDLTFVLDIGGQDMKCMKIKDGVIDTIMLNEACSSGCGSFVETFARSLKLSVADFAASGLKARSPIDLGTRCTVFMNSRVKQAQKEGASVADISSGISYSIIKNALFKVIRFRNADELGARVVVQGGTFYNDSILRAFEKITGLEVVRPDIAGIMGAFGAALIARNRARDFEEAENGEKQYISTMIGSNELNVFATETSMRRCKGCGNHCLLTINKFPDGSQYVSGNRCEKGSGIKNKYSDLPSIYEYKSKRVFDYKPLPMDKAPLGKIGIVRALNMFEDYPFWFTFLSRLGFRVVLSPRSNKKLYELGMNSIPSESVCYPAKLAHGHLENLIKRGVTFIFHPCIPKSVKEDSDCGNNFNCPVVASYSETLDANVDNIEKEGIRFYHPFLPLDNPKRMAVRCYEEFSQFGLAKKDIFAAVNEAYAEMDNFHEDIQRKGEEYLQHMKENNLKGIVLVGRPYHIDPEVNHGIPEMIKSYGFVVFSEDSVAHLSKVDRPLRVYDQWVYHSRMFNAASLVCKEKDLELIQLVSFGCGIDAITSDQIQEILDRYGKIYTQVKIDEISTLGAVRIRIRSLMAAMDAREKQNFVPRELYANQNKRPVFTKAMKRTHTILIPMLSPHHFQFFPTALTHAGLNVELLPQVDEKAIDIGLKYCHNDACYPTVIVIGQIASALLSGKYDPDKVVIFMTQTGGGCRATNYIAFIRKMLKDIGMTQIPVLSINMDGLEKNPGFKWRPIMGLALLMSIVYGDLLMRVLYATRPYEKVRGSANELYEKWCERMRDHISRKAALFEYSRIIHQCVQEFDNLELRDLKKPKVGIVGEILVKFHPEANNNLVEYLEEEGAEAVVPDMLDFLLYGRLDRITQRTLLSGTLKGFLFGKVANASLEAVRRSLKNALSASKRFSPPPSIYELARKTEHIVSLGNQFGEGWFLTGEMIELIEEGVPNILCVQPFACLPNHITGKGMIRKLRRYFPESNIAAIDYDPGASEVNQLNRIKLMLSIAFKKLERESDIEVARASEIQPLNEMMEKLEDEEIALEQKAMTEEIEMEDMTFQSCQVGK